MAEEIPVSEVRRVVIHYEIKVPETSGVPDQSERYERDLADRIRRELIRTGSRNPDIFGGRA
jgi:hypothetical protein